MMVKRYLLNMLLYLLPPTRCFGVKRIIARWAGIYIENGVCINGQTCFFGEGKVSIGGNTWIGIKSTFYRTTDASIIIGKNCDIGPEVSFITGTHEIGDQYRRAGKGLGRDIIIGDGCWIGARVTIIGGVSISKGTIIGAGAVVCDDVQENSLYAGVPARLIRTLDVNARHENPANER